MFPAVRCSVRRIGFCRASNMARWTGAQLRFRTHKLSPQPRRSTFRRSSAKSAWPIRSPTSPTRYSAHSNDPDGSSGSEHVFKHSYVSRQSDAHQLRRQSLQCYWTSSLQLSADGPRAAGLVIQPF